MVMKRDDKYRERDVYIAFAALSCIYILFTKKKWNDVQNVTSWILVILW
jgi:hypothetical protein